MSGGAVPVPHARDSGPPDAREAVVLLHGIGGDRALWPDLPLSLAGRRALAWDQPGYGASDSLPATTFPVLAESLLSLLDVRGVARAHLVGHSMGGMVALEFAAAHPSRVASLVLVATSAAFGSRDPAFARDFLAARLGPLDAGRPMAEVAEEVAGGALGPDPDPAVRAALVAAMARTPEATYRATVGCLVGFDRRDALPGLAMPTLLVAGAEDRVAPPRGMARMAEAIPGARGRPLVAIPGAGHFPHLERPRDFDAALAAFLSTLA